MSKLAKVFAAAAIVGAVALVALTILVNVFLSEEKLKGIIIPQAEKALGRKVEISGISAGLFSGITVKDMAVKEADNKRDFAGIREFVLSYELLPLLSKKIVISDIRLIDPRITIHRNKAGEFNFSSLAILAAAAAPKEPGPKPPVAAPTPRDAALPLALTVDRITISKAGLTLSDELGELPEVKGTIDAGIGVDLAGGLKSLRLSGDLNFVVDALYRKLKSHVQGTAHFNQQQISFNVDADLENEKATLSGSVADYLGTPDIRMDISSKKLDLDHLLGLLAGLGQSGAGADTGQKENKSAPVLTASPAAAPAAGLPPGLKAQGAVQVEKSIYKGLAIDNVLLRYTLANGILKLTEMGTDIAEGRVTGKARVDLNKPGLVYDGQLQMDKVKVEQLVAGITETDFEQLSGTLRTGFSFNGRGLVWSQISRTLQAKGDYGLFDGEIRETPVTRVMADLLKLDDLRSFSFEKIAGNLRVEDGRLILDSTMNGKDVSALSQGSIGLDGTINMPFTIRLSPQLSRKLRKSLAVAGYLSTENGETELNLKVGGTVKHPRAVIDEVAVKNVVLDIGARELGKLLSDEKDREGEEPAAQGEEGEKKKGDAGIQLLKGILGQ